MRLFLLTTLTMTAFAANSVLNRMGVAYGWIDPVSFGLVRIVAGAAMLAGLIALRRIWSSGAVWTGSGGRVTGTLSLLLYMFGFSLAYGALDAGAGALILFGMVQITMFAGALIAGERVPPGRWIGAGLAFFGLVYLMAPGSSAGDSLRHAALMAVAGIGWGVYSLSARGQRDPLAATAWHFITAAPLALALVWILPEAGTGHVLQAGGIGLALISGAITSALGYYLWYSILPLLGAARGGVAQLTVPLIALTGGMVFLGESLTLRFALSSVFILGGVAIAVRSPRQR